MSEAPAQTFDIVVLGAGPIGCATARDAAGRGLRVALIDAQDIGGLLPASMVRGAIMRLNNACPSLTLPDRILHRESRRLRRIASHILTTADLGRTRKANRGWRLWQSSKVSDQLSPFEEYLPGLRFCALCAQDAYERGAQVMTYTTVTQANRADGLWRLELKGAIGAVLPGLKARLVVDTYGGLDLPANPQSPSRARFVRGDQLHVTAALAPHTPPAMDLARQVQPDTYVLRQQMTPEFDGMILVRPESAVAPEETQPEAVQEMVELLGADNQPSPITATTFCMTAPEMDKEPGQNTPQLYSLRIKTSHDRMALFRVRGGNCGSARYIAELTVAEMAPYVTMIGKRWTGFAPLPGADFEEKLHQPLLAQLLADHPFLNPEHAKRLFRAYGTQCTRMLDGIKSLPDMGQHFGADLYEVEVKWLVAHEFARSAEDILWRRSFLGMWLSPDQTAGLDAYLDQHRDQIRVLS